MAYIGQYEFIGPVDATDPCYTADERGRQGLGVTNIPLVPGLYFGYAIVDPDHNRISHLVVIQADLVEIYGGNPLDALEFLDKTEIGDIDVDSGCAGIFQDLPDFDPNVDLYTWPEIASMILRAGKFTVLEWGFVSDSGWGDGSYPVYVYTNGAGETVACAIDYLVDRD